MTPTEVINRILDLGICYQMAFQNQAPQAQKEDWSQVGFNQEKDSAPDAEVEYYSKIQIITDKEKLLGHSQWLLSTSPPKAITKKLEGPLVSVFLDKKRRLVVRGDEIPFGGGAMTLKFGCDSIRNIELTKNLLVVTTIFGQTGIMVPAGGLGE